MTKEIISVLAVLAPLFTRPTWNNINTLFIGSILCRGAKRITSILRVMDLSEVKNFSKYHRVLSRTQWYWLPLKCMKLKNYWCKKQPRGMTKKEN